MFAQNVIKNVKFQNSKGQAPLPPVSDAHP